MIAKFSYTIIRNVEEYLNLFHLPNGKKIFQHELLAINIYGVCLQSSNLVRFYYR
jgi:hypothetical protein